jgi:hypothetical protein
VSDERLILSFSEKKELDNMIEEILLFFCQPHQGLVLYLCTPVVFVRYYQFSSQQSDDSKLFWWL